MIVAMSCECGNAEPSKAHLYEGFLGYTAVICLECGRYYDHYGKHEPDEFSKYFVEQSNGVELKPDK